MIAPFSRRLALGLVLLALAAAAGGAARAAGDDAQLLEARVLDLRPTQMAVGMIEVDEKADKAHHMAKHDPDKLKEFLTENPEPVVLGPGKERYIIDHHHLALALDRAEIARCYYKVVADLSDLSESKFWSTMNERHWVYPFDENGKGPHPYSALPRTVRGLKDDPYRSLAQAVRKHGGYRKSDAPFAEFHWADFFRERVKIGHNGKHFDDAVKEAVELAHSKEAEQAKLPGFSKTPIKD